MQTRDAVVQHLFRISQGCSEFYEVKCNLTELTTMWMDCSHLLLSLVILILHMRQIPRALGCGAFFLGGGNFPPEFFFRNSRWHLTIP